VDVAPYGQVFGSFPALDGAHAFAEEGSNLLPGFETFLRRGGVVLDESRLHGGSIKQACVSPILWGARQHAPRCATLR
jgi:hypothetical protein